MSPVQDNQEAERSDFVGMAEKFGDLFREKIGGFVISAGAALNRTFPGGTKMQVMLAQHRKVIMVTFQNPVTDSFASLTGRTSELTPCGLLSVEGKHHDVAAMFNDVCEGLREAKDAEAAVKRAQHYTGPSFKDKQALRDEQERQSRGGGKRDRSRGSKQATLQAMYYDSLPAAQPVKKYPAKKSGKGVSHG